MQKIVFFIQRWLHSHSDLIPDKLRGLQFSKFKEMTRRSQYLETSVDNTSGDLLSFTDHYSSCEGTGFRGGLVIKIPAHTKKTIHSGRFLKEYMSYRDPYNYQEIHVMCGERVLHVMSDDDFQNNKGKMLLLDLVDGVLFYAFVDKPKRDTIRVHQWLRGEPGVWGAAPGPGA